MIKKIEYKGALITDTGIPGETKADGIIPAHPGILRLSQDRWIIFISTLDPMGWDAVRSIIYQLRADSPDGPLIKEAILARCNDNWRLPGENKVFSKRLGMPIPFGVPKGAHKNGKLLPNQNIFLVKWYRYAHWLANGKLINPHDQKLWPNAENIAHRTRRLEHVQFRLNDSGDDIEFITTPQLLHQAGYDSETHFCSIGENCAINHAMTPPVPINENYTEWLEIDTFTFEEGLVAPVLYKFNTEKKLYEWTQTGKPFSTPDRQIGESSIIYRNNEFLISFRDFKKDGVTCWYKGKNPLGHLEGPFFSQLDEGPRESPRHTYICPDGVIRIFGNNKPIRVGGRSPLFCWEVNPENYELVNRQVVIDIEELGLPFKTPFADMAKLVPHQGNRQLLLFRLITAKQTACHHRDILSAAEQEQAGTHYAEILYDKEYPNEWELSSTETGL